MRIASIDIGTNTILMLIADIDQNHRLSIVRDEHSIARLGKDVDSNRHIFPDKFEGVYNVLHSYSKIARECNVDKIVACGTSALRDADNRDEFIRFIQDKLGITIRVLSGLEEAECTYRGSIWGFPQTILDTYIGVLDIGGGSTELIIGRQNNVEHAKSIDIGSVRLTERILKASPPSEALIIEAQNFVRSHLLDFPHFFPDIILYGVAGTLTTLAAIDQKMKVFDPLKVHGHRLHRKRIIGIFNNLKILSLEEIRKIPSMHPQRADIILAGIVILIEVLTHFQIDEIVVSNQGLRYGLLLNEVHQ